MALDGWYLGRTYLVLSNFASSDFTIRNEALTYARENFYEFTSDERFVTLPREIIKLIFEGSVAVLSQEYICDTLFSWIRHNKPSIADGYRLILDIVQLPLVSVRYIESKIFPYASSLPDYGLLMILSQQLCMNQFLMTRLTNTQRAAAPSTVPPVVNQRTLSPYKLSFIVKKDASVSCMQTFDSIADLWLNVQLPTIEGDAFGTAIFGDLLMIIGGIRSLQIIGNVYLFNMKTHSFMQISPLHFKRSDMGVAVVHRDDCVDVYAIGGWRQTNNMKNIYNCVEKWNSKTSKWAPVQSMQYQRGTIIPAVLNGKIYVAGGYGGNAIGMERYDPETDVWTSMANMKDRRRYCTLVAHAGKIYAIGGSSTLSLSLLNSSEVYDPEKNEWFYFPRLPQPTRVYAFSLNNKLFCIPLDYDKPTLLEYDVTIATWIESTYVTVPSDLIAAHVHIDQNYIEPIPGTSKQNN